MPGRRWMPSAFVLAALLPAGCVAPPAPVPTLVPTLTPILAPIQVQGAARPGAPRFRAVLVAGDASLPVFDRAADGMAAFLQDRGAAAGITRLSAAPSAVAHDGVRSATLGHVLDAVERMAPGPGEGCLVFATSHGAIHRGLVLAAPAPEVLSPAALDGALLRGCGDAPTVVVMSGCFTGTFAQAPMARPNRVVLTAAAPDRTSFGCGAGFDLTFYDKCLLAELSAGGTWDRLHARVAGCVAATEAAGGYQPSQPRLWLGPAVANLTVPGNAPGNTPGSAP